MSSSRRESFRSNLPFYGQPFLFRQIRADRIDYIEYNRPRNAMINNPSLIASQTGQVIEGNLRQ
jgi:hypothetical protein